MSCRTSSPNGCSISRPTAAYSWQTDADAILRANVVGTAQPPRRRVGSGVEAFVNTGSSSEYGLKDHRADARTSRSSRTASTRPPRPRPRMLCGTAAVSGRTERQHAAPVLDVRPLGGAESARFRRLPSKVSSGPFPPLVTPDTARDFVWVGDVVDAYLLAARTRAFGARRGLQRRDRGRRRPSARPPRSPATCSAIEASPELGHRCRLARGTRTLGGRQLRDPGSSSAGGRPAVSGKGSRNLHRGSWSGRTSSPDYWRLRG